MPGAAAYRAVACSVLVLLSGCESSYYSKAVRQDTPAAYLAFLSRYPEGTHAARARARLERVRFWSARRADRPLGYQMYLQHHPEGEYAAACRARLAKLALRRAATPADLQLILERYPGSAEAKEARRRLPPLLAQRALASADPALARGFLDLHPDSSEAPAVRAHLAKLRYPALLDRQLDLEAFIEAYAGTAEAAQANRRLEALLARDVEDSRDPRLLGELRTRFPKSARLPRLEALVLEQRLLEAVARLDVDALQELSQRETLPGRERALFLSRWCVARAKPCARARELARQAAPWTPAVSLGQLRQQAHSPDLQRAWTAIAQLGWLSDRTVGAGDLLLELTGSQRLSTVRAAAAALDTWVSRLPEAALRRFVDRHLRRSFRAPNANEVQQLGHLLLLAGRQAEGLGHLERLSRRTGHVLGASYLLVRWQRKRGRKAAREALARFAAAARHRLGWLRNAFPAELDADSFFPAVLAERELFALHEALAEAHRNATPQGLAELAELVSSAANLLATWRAELTKVDKGFAPAHVVDLRREAEEHEQGRTRALAALRTFGRAGREVSGAICEGAQASARLPACAATRR